MCLQRVRYVPVTCPLRAQASERRESLEESSVAPPEVAEAEAEVAVLVKALERRASDEAVAAATKEEEERGEELPSSGPAPPNVARRQAVTHEVWLASRATPTTRPPDDDRSPPAVTAVTAATQRIGAEAPEILLLAERRRAYVRACREAEEAAKAAERALTEVSRLPH